MIGRRRSNVGWLFLLNRQAPDSLTNEADGRSGTQVPLFSKLAHRPSYSRHTQCADSLEIQFQCWHMAIESTIVSISRLSIERQYQVSMESCASPRLFNMSCAYSDVHSVCHPACTSRGKSVCIFNTAMGSDARSMPLGYKLKCAAFGVFAH